MGRVKINGWLSVSPSWKAAVKITPWNFSPFGEDFYEIDIVESKLKKPISVWCSWYAFGSKIDAVKILSNAKFIAENNLPIEYVIIDDGWTLFGVS